MFSVNYFDGERMNILKNILKRVLSVIASFAVIFILFSVLGSFFTTSNSKYQVVYNRLNPYLKDGEKTGNDQNFVSINLSGPVMEMGAKSINVKNVRSKLKMISDMIYTGNLDINGVLINIDSPGGSPNESRAISEQIHYFKKTHKIPVYCIVNSVCASGGYWIAVECDKILAYRSALVGSVGVISQFLNFHELLKNNGVKPMTLRMGKDKALINPFEELTNETFREQLGDYSAEVYNAFVERVVEKRNNKITTEDLTNNIGSKVFSSKKAVELGLIDHVVDSFEDVFYKLNLVKDDVDSTVIIEIQDKPTWYEELQASFFLTALSCLNGGINYA